MARYRRVVSIGVDKLIPFTPAEEIERDIEEAEHAAEQVSIRTDPEHQLNDMTRKEFYAYIAMHGYDDAIDAVLAALKTTDLEQYAKIKSDIMGGERFRFKEIQRLIGIKTLRDLIPVGINVKRSVMSERWLQVKERNPTT